MKPEIQIEDYGTSVHNPVLLSTIRAGYQFCDKLRCLDERLEYSRRGSDSVPGFDKPIDIYDFSRFGEKFCTTYVYAYHTENIEEVPKPFLTLDEEDALAESFLEEIELSEGDNEDEDSEELMQALLQDEIDNPPSREELFASLVRNILEKHFSEIDPTGENWGEDDEQWLSYQIRELELNPLIEPLVLQEWDEYLRKKHRPHREFFIHSFFPSYHHNKLEPYLPQEAREKNQQVKVAYGQLLKLINQIQFFAGEDQQERIESDLQQKAETISVLNQCNTKFCTVQLHSDFSGRCYLDYWLDLDIFEMLQAKPVSTLLRGIHELTPGLEEWVNCRSLSYDCEAWFGDIKKESNYEEESPTGKSRRSGITKKKM